MSRRPYSFPKLCKVCGTTHTREQFLALPPPASGVRYGSGLYFANCTCGSTLAVVMHDAHVIPPKEAA